MYLIINILILIGLLLVSNESNSWFFIALIYITIFFVGVEFHRVFGE